MPNKKTIQKVRHTPELINPEADNTATNVSGDCVEITFVNLDRVNMAYVNGYPLGPSPADGIPGGFVVFENKEDEQEETNFSVKCFRPTGQLGLWVWRKFRGKTMEIDL